MGCLRLRLRLRADRFAGLISGGFGSGMVGAAETGERRNALRRDQRFWFPVGGAADDDEGRSMMGLG
jgi:hypothetical protein